MKKKLLSVVTILAMLFSMISFAPTASYAIGEAVCQIGSVPYESFSDALAAAIDGDTITLLNNIEYPANIYLENKDITLDLNGFVFNLNNASGDGLWVDNGSWNLAGAGEFNVSCSYIAVYAFNGGSATVTNATSTGGFWAASASDPGSTVTVLGDAVVGGSGGKAVNSDAGASVVVWGDAIATGSGSYTLYSDGEDSSIEVMGNVTGTAIGVYSRNSASALVHGNVTGTSGDGIVIESSGNVTVLGDVSATGGAGAAVSTGAATIEGSITASPYLYLYGEIKTIDDYIEPTTKLGYRTYSYNDSTVWVAAENIFYEDFESYTENAYPDSFTLQYDGTSPADQKVISTEDYSGMTGKVFQLSGQPGWSSEQYVPLVGELPANIVIDAYIQPANNSRNAEFALRNLDVGDWGTRISSIWFEDDGTITAVRNGNDSDRIVIGYYTVGEWYRITLDNDLSARTYDVYINGKIARSDIPMHPTLSPTVMSLIAHNYTFSTAYFDNVGSYRELPYIPDAWFSGGTGTLEDPYLISTEEDLFELSETAAMGESFTGKYFKQTADIGLTQDWVPIKDFNGIYDGNLKTVSNLSLDSHIDNIGFFGTTDSSAELKNIILDGVEFANGYLNVGALIGNSHLSSVQNCVANNINISGDSYIGGLVGYNHGGSISDCHANGIVEGGYYTGGLAGYKEYGTIIDSSAAVEIIGDNYAGGLVGYNYNCGISGSYATGNIQGCYYVGGLAGYSEWYASITQCHATGDISYSEYDCDYFGGLIGGNDRYSSVSNSYSTGNVSGNDGAGGLAGYNSDSSSITECYTAGTVSGLEYTYPLVGYSYGALTKCYYLDEISGEDVGPGLHAEAMKTQASYVGWDFTDIWDIGLDSIYDFPTLSSGGMIKSTAGEGGSISPNGITLLLSGGEQSYTIEEDTGYSITDVIVDGQNFGNISSFTFSAVHTSHAIHIEFEQAASPAGGGSNTSPTVLVVTEVHNGLTTTSTEVPFSAVSGTVSANVSTLIVDAILDKIDSAGGDEKNDLIELGVDTKQDAKELKVMVLQKDLAEIIDKTDASLGVNSPLISIIFDAKALEAISAAESGGTVVISAGIIDNDTLSAADSAKVQGRPVYDLTVVNGDTKISSFKGGHATVTIPYDLQPDENPNAVVVYYLADDGTLEIVRGHYDAALESVVFKTSHFSNFVIGYHPVEFTDVKENAWYKNAVGFVAARGITSGTGDNQFSPDAKLTRAQFIVLLMNAYQISTQNQSELDRQQNFADAGNTYYTEYLSAAKSLGIANGIGNNMFAPEKEITRQEMFVMLYNALKVIDEAPAATLDTELSDFNDADQVADWASGSLSDLVKAGIITGNNSKLNPASSTTRAEIAQVLYNLLSK